MNIIYHARPWQWYKNVVVFLPILFGGLFFSSALLKTIVAFFLLCMISSGNYMLNDVLDKKQDRHNKNKKKIKNPFALACASITIIILSLWISTVYFPTQFTFLLLTLFLISTAYSLWLKHVFLVDIFTISINFVIRAVSGAYIIVIANKPYIWVSPWLIICTFFLAFFLAASKRYGEHAHQKKAFRKTLQEYTPDVTKALLITATVCLFMAYTLYSFLGEQPKMIFTLPIAAYLIFYYQSAVLAHSPIAEKPHKALQQKEILIGLLLWALLTAYLLY